jgi:TolB-like protein
MAVMLVAGLWVAPSTQVAVSASQMLSVAQVQPASDRPSTVAVLPFRNLSGASGDHWIGAGIAESIATGLEAAGGFQVLREVDRRTADPPGYRVNGAYQRVANRLRITARIMSDDPAVIVPAVIVNGTIDALFALQDELVGQILQRLRQVDGRLAQRLPAELVGDPGGVEVSAPGGAIPGDADSTDVPALAPVSASLLALQGAVEGGGASERPAGRYAVEPTRTAQQPSLDGALDEAAWQNAAVIDDFIQQEPAEGDPATERTVVRLMYDAEMLYVGVEAYDSEPTGIIATEMRRDSRQLLDEDNFQIIIDTFNDSRSGYMFVTSPLGARLEQQISEEGEGGYSSFNSSNSNINIDWDGVWNVATRRTDEGWFAEIAVPMVTMRFPKTDQQVWGVNFMRNIRRKNEQVYWAPIPKGYNLTRVSLAGTMTGLAGVDRGMDLRVTPYVLAGGRQDRNASASFDGSGFNDVGLDVKYGIAAGLNLDVTVNTDFAQVEVDEQQVNLTRFPLFFPEKRDFFLENAGMFSVKSQQAFGRVADLFFTRRVGLAGGRPVPILGGTRLTGKVQRHNVAVLNIQTQEIGARPGENFFVARYSRDIFARSKIGGIVVNKEAVGAAHFNRTFAVDTSLTPHPFLSITGFVAKTESPDVDRDDMMGHMMVMWLSPGARIYSEYTDIQDGFNAEVGFVPRIGIRRSKLHGQWNPRPGRWCIRSMDPMMNVEYTTDQQNRLLTRMIHHMIGFQFADGSNLTLITNKEFERLDLPFQITEDVAIPAGVYRFWSPSVSYRSDPSRRVSMNARYAPQGFFDGRRVVWGGGINWRATSRIAAQLSFRRSDVELSGGGFVADLASATFDLALSPEITLRSLTQYNSTTSSVSTSMRFNWIYRPGSDIYIAYDELRTDDFLLIDPTLRHYGRMPWIQNRQIAIKMTYLLSR